MKIIEKAIKELLDTNPFYAYFFLNSRIEYDKYNVPTAAVTLTKKGPMIVFNTEWINDKTTKELASVVEHEVLHVVFDHVNPKREKENGYDHLICNIAQDLAINQYITRLPDGCITLKLGEKITGEKMEPLQIWEYYYSFLIKKAELIKSMFKFDIHGLEGEGSATEEERKIALRDAIDSAMKSAKGNVPEAILKVFDSLNFEAKVPWEQVLANFISKSISVTVKSTRNKMNRRFGLDQPGKKKKRELVLGVCTDSSGSVSDESFGLFLNEIARISKICQKLYLIDADCTVQNVEIVKKNKFTKRERHGCGGTAYQPAIDACMERKCDAIIYFGDFDCADRPVNPGVPFLWVGVGNSPKPGDFGAEIRI